MIVQNPFTRLGLYYLLAIKFTQTEDNYVEGTNPSEPADIDIRTVVGI